MPKKLRNFDQVIGHKYIIQWFENCIKDCRLPHVTMLQGPAGIGKSTIAKIAACEIAYREAPNELEAAKDKVVDKDESTDAVKLYNMSNLKSQEEVQKVKADLSVGFSSTGVKVIIMDEAHGMDDAAQDSLLTQFENLPNNVYIIVCTTELEKFRDAFLSRCVLRRLRPLQPADMRTLLSNAIKEAKLTFNISDAMVLTLLSSYTGNEPRRALNLIESLEPGSTVTVDELSTFINVYEGKQLVILINYLYSNSIANGISYIQNLDVSPSLQNTFIMLADDALGGENSIVDRETLINLRTVTAVDSCRKLIGFVSDVTTHKLTKSTLTGYFLKWAIKDDSNIKVKQYTQDEVKYNDLAVMKTILEKDEAIQTDTQYKSLSSLFNEGEEV